MTTVATRRAVLDVLGHGLRGDLAQSAVGVGLGTHLQAALTADISNGAAPGELMAAMREACDLDPVAYARVIELVVLAGLDELQVIAGLSEGGPTPQRQDVPAAPPRRAARRRR